MFIVATVLRKYGTHVIYNILTRTKILCSTKSISFEIIDSIHYVFTKKYIKQKTVKIMSHIFKSKKIGIQKV